MNGDYKGTKLFGVDENGRKYDREARRKKNKIISNVLLVVALLFAIVAAIFLLIDPLKNRMRKKEVQAQVEIGRAHV